MSSRDIHRFVAAAVVLMCFAISTGVVVTQNQTSASTQDLNGTWTLGYAGSNVTTVSTFNPSVTLKITHAAPEVRFIRTSEGGGRTSTLETVYYTDERGEENPATMVLSVNRGEGKPDVIKSKSRWSGKKLVITSTLRNVLAGRLVEFEMIDEWKPSKDGKTLTQTTRFVHKPDPLERNVFIPANRPDTKRVYRRVEN